jgi:hypothetical protein
MSGGKGVTFENDILKAIFWGSSVANLLDNAATSPATQFYLTLHTADPRTGNQSTSEATYPGYARKAINRDNTGFSISGNSVTLAADQNFNAATGGSETYTWFGLGMGASGATKLLFAGPLTPSIAIANGVTPKLLAGTTFTES